MTLTLFSFVQQIHFFVSWSNIESWCGWFHLGSETISVVPGWLQQWVGSAETGPIVCSAVLWPLLFLCRPGWGRRKPEQWQHIAEAGGDWLHGRWGPPPALEPGQHSWPWRSHATPPPGPPLLPRCPGTRRQHLQRAALRIRRAADHPGAQRSGFRVRVGQPRRGPRLGVFFPPRSLLFFSLFPPLLICLSVKRATRKPHVWQTRNQTLRAKMASTSGSGQAAFGLGRRKKNPGLLDQIGKFFGGDKKRKGKVRKHRKFRRPSTPSVCWSQKHSLYILVY